MAEFGFSEEQEMLRHAAWELAQKELQRPLLGDERFLKGGEQWN